MFLTTNCWVTMMANDGQGGRYKTLSLGPTARSSRSGGFTLLEVMVAISVLTIAFLGFGSFFVVNSNTFDRIREEAMVTYAMRQMAEMIRGAPFARIWTAYEDYSFTVPEINASGKVTCFTNEKDESVDAKRLGLPRDLNGDGAATSTDVSASYVLLPLKIEVTWTGNMGAQSRALYLLFAQERN